MKTRLSALLSLFCLLLPFTASASTITDDEIDRFLEAVPKTAYVLNKMRIKVKMDPALSKALSAAQLNGNYMRRMVKAAKQWPEYPKLEEIVTASGFASIDDWSLVVDRVFGVVSSAHWVVLVASMPTSNSDTSKLTVDTNLFEFIQNEDNDPELREKYRNELAQMCEKMCYDESDLAVVGARYDEIQTIIKKRR